MCVILAATTRHVTKSEMLMSELKNPDGGGIAWITNDKKIRYQKDLKAEAIMDLIDAENIQLPYVVHFRIATVGGVIAELTHPFPVSMEVPLDLAGEADAALFHNGHWGDWQELILNSVCRSDVELPGGEWSDSRAMAWLVARHGSSILNFIKGQRIALMDGGWGWPQLFGDWHDLKGVSASNLHWQVQAVTTEPRWVYEGYDWSHTYPRKTDVAVVGSAYPTNSIYGPGRTDTPKLVTPAVITPSKYDDTVLVDIIKERETTRLSLHIPYGIFREASRITDDAIWEESERKDARIETAIVRCAEEECDQFRLAANERSDWMMIRIKELGHEWITVNEQPLIGSKTPLLEMRLD